MEGNRIVYRYTGRDGEHHSGIPARDLTADEIAALAAPLRALLAASPIYRVMPDAPARPVPARRAPAATDQGGE
jgi:hypothetical protein